MPDSELFDVVAVNLATSAVRLIDTGKTRRNAEAIEEMAVMRRGVDEEFFAVVPHGAYEDGSHWKGLPESEELHD